MQKEVNVREFSYSMDRGKLAIQETKLVGAQGFMSKIQLAGTCLTLWTLF